LWRMEPDGFAKKEKEKMEPGGNCKLTRGRTIRSGRRSYFDRSLASLGVKVEDLSFPAGRRSLLTRRRRRRSLPVPGLPSRHRRAQARSRTRLPAPPSRTRLSAPPSRLPVAVAPRRTPGPGPPR
jgi:hypothetical protein